jgi:hypothetical protein
MFFGVGVVAMWIVRVRAWLSRCRRLAKDFENLARNAFVFLVSHQSGLCSESFVMYNQPSGPDSEA